MDNQVCFVSIIYHDLTIGVEHFTGINIVALELVNELRMVICSLDMVNYYYYSNNESFIYSGRVVTELVIIYQAGILQVNIYVVSMYVVSIAAICTIDETIAESMLEINCISIYVNHHVVEVY